MLTGLALDYYFSNSSNSIIAMFEEVYDSIQTYFEKAKYKKSILSKLNMTTFKSIIKKNKRKLIEKCLQLLINNFCHLQNRLDSELRTDKFIYNKFINTYCNIMKSCDQSRDGSNQIGTILDQYWSRTEVDLVISHLTT